jgi:hypothetical protein
MPVPEGKTRWRRFTAATAIVTAMAAGLIYLTATGAIAVSLQISGIPFKLSASNLSGDNFVQYATVDSVSNENSGALLQMSGVSPDAAQTGSNGAVYDATTVTVLGTATIENLHQTVCAPLPGALQAILPKDNLLVTIDGGRSAGAPVTATGLVVDAPLLTAREATFDNIQIGADLGLSLNKDANGNFAQRATHVSINDLNQVAIGTTAGQFKLTGLGLGATFVTSCP